MTPAVDQRDRCRRHRRATTRAVRVAGDTIIITLPDNLPRGHPDRQLPRHLGRRPSGRGIHGVFDRRRDRGRRRRETNAGSVNGLIWLARIGVYLGLFVGVGGAFFACWIGRARAGSRLIIAALVAGLVSAAASLGLQGLDLLDLPLGGLLTAAPWKAAAATSLFQSLLIAVAAMTAGIVALRSRVAGIAATLSALRAGRRRPVARLERSRRHARRRNG